MAAERKDPIPGGAAFLPVVGQRRKSPHAPGNNTTILSNAVGKIVTRGTGDSPDDAISETSGTDEKAVAQAEPDLGGKNVPYRKRWRGAGIPGVGFCRRSGIDEFDLAPGEMEGFAIEHGSGSGGRNGACELQEKEPGQPPPKKGRDDFHRVLGSSKAKNGVTAIFFPEHVELFLSVLGSSY